MSTGRAPRSAQRPSGQAIVEFALVALPFILLIVGALQVAIWGYAMAVAQLAVRDAATAAEGAYLAQYQPNAYVQALGPSTAWRLAEASAESRARRTLSLLPHGACGGVPAAVLSLEEPSTSRDARADAERRITATVCVWPPSLGVLPRPAILSPYIASVSVRPGRFYSF